MKRLIFTLIICIIITDLKAQTFTSYTAGNSGLPNNNIFSVAIDKFGNKWVGAENNLVRFDGTNWTSWNLNITYADKGIYSIAIDNQNNKWLGTAYGLFKFDGTNFTQYLKSNSGLTNNYVYAVAVDSNGNIWAGTLHGISRFNGLNWYVFDSITKFVSIAVEPKDQHAVWAVIEQRDSNNNAHAYRFLNNSMTDFPIYYPTLSGGFKTIAIDKQNNKWIGSLWRGLVKLDKENIFTDYMDSIIMLNQSNVILSIAFDEFNNKWCGSATISGSFGASLLKFTDTTWTNFQGFAPNAWLYSIAIDSSGNKWMALYGQGLWKMACVVPAIVTGKIGPDTLNRGQTVTYKLLHQNDALTYHWTLPLGFIGSNTADSITINIDSNAVSGVISVYGHNSCGNGMVKNFNIIVKTNTGVETYQNDTNFKLYPNPAKDRIFIETNAAKEYEIKIYNALGTCILQQNHQTPLATINIENLGNGFYFYKITDKSDKTISGKFVKNQKL